MFNITQKHRETDSNHFHIFFFFFFFRKWTFFFSCVRSIYRLYYTSIHIPQVTFDRQRNSAASRKLLFTLIFYYYYFLLFSFKKKKICCCSTCLCLAPCENREDINFIYPDPPSTKTNGTKKKIHIMESFFGGCVLGGEIRGNILFSSFTPFFFLKIYIFIKKYLFFFE